MYRLFQELPTIDKGNIDLPEFIYVKGHYLRQLAIIKEFYHNTTRWVDNQHVLVKLLTLLNVSFNRELRNYVDVAGDQAMRLSSQLRMTSSINRGSVFSPGVFYGASTAEMLVISDEEFDIQEAAADWENMEPVRVLRHPFTDLSMARADGDYKGSTEQGYVVIEINVAKLALQYRMWVQHKKYQGENIDSIHMFVSMYPITNMLDSHLDIALFNRMAALYLKRPLAPYRKSHSFFIPDYTDRVDRVLAKLIGLQKYRTLDFDGILMSLPTITKDTMFERMMLPKITPTRQIKWALIIARIPLIRFLLKLNDDTSNQRNAMYLSRLRVALREMRNDRTLYQGLPDWVVNDIEYDIQEEVSPLI